MLIYIIVIILSLLLARLSEKKNKFLYTLLAVIILSMLAGVRDIGTGTDTRTYTYFFSSIVTGKSSYFVSEPGFVILSRIVMSIFGDVRYAFTFWAFITNFFMLLTLWKNKGYGSYSFMAFIYICLLYPQSFNITRQLVAVSIVYFSSDFLKHKKYAFFIIGTLIATSIHNSAIIGIAILPIYYYMFNKSALNRVKLFALVSISLPALYFAIISSFREKIQYYTGLSMDGNTSIFVILYIIMGVWFLGVLHQQLVCGNRYNLSEVEYTEKQYITVLFLIGALISILGAFYDQMERIALYFIVFITQFAAISSKDNKYCQIYKALFILLALYYLFIKVFISGEQGIFLPLV